MKGKKQKSVTDDWRFWAACITGAGFASTLFSLYQKTGGFGSDSSGGDGDGGGGGDSQELVL